MEAQQLSVIDSIYAAALNPARYPELVRRWFEAFPVKDQHACALNPHFERAARALNCQPRSAAPQPGCWFTLDARRTVIEVSPVAGAKYGLAVGTAWDRLPLDDLDDARRALNLLRANPNAGSACINLQLTSAHRPISFVAKKRGDGSVRLMSTESTWQPQAAQRFAQALSLTDAELEVVRLMIEGFCAREIAEQRGASTLTVRTQIRAVYEKTGAASQCEVVRLAQSYFAMTPANDTDRACRQIIQGEGRPYLLLTHRSFTRLEQSLSEKAVASGRPLWIGSLNTSGGMVAHLNDVDLVATGVAITLAERLVSQRAGLARHLHPVPTSSCIQKFEADAARWSDARLSFAAAVGGWTGQKLTYKALALETAHSSPQVRMRASV